MSVQVQSHSIELVLQNSTERVEIAIFNEAGKPIDPTALQLNILDCQDRVISQDVFYPSVGQEVGPLPSRIVRSGRGKFYFPFGLDNANGYPAVLYSSLQAAPPWDISVNDKLKVKIDGKAALVITLTATTPTAATPLEVVDSINKALVASPVYGALYRNSARYAFGKLFLTSPMKTNTETSTVNIDPTQPNNAGPTVFGPIPSQVSGGVTDEFILALLSNRTLVSGDALFQWQVTAGAGLGSTSIIQVVKVASPKAFSLLPYFRLELDKAIKQTGHDLARTGYTDAQLMSYLALAVTEINAYQPITNLTLDSFPAREFMMILMWTATLVALLSQGLFAIDTDIEYSDRGASFRMDHASKIQSYVSLIAARLEQRMQSFKLQYADVGTVKIEAGVNYRLASVLNAAPVGSLFRGLFVGGGGSSI